DQAALEAAQTELATLEDRIEGAAKAVGSLEQQQRAYQAQKDKLAALQERAGRLKALRAMLECDKQDLADWTAKVQELEAKAGSGPRQGLAHDLARCLDDAYNTEDVSFKFPAELDGRILKTLGAYETQYGKLDAIGNVSASAE